MGRRSEWRQGGEGEERQADREPGAPSADPMWLLVLGVPWLRGPHPSLGGPCQVGRWSWGSALQQHGAGVSRDPASPVICSLLFLLHAPNTLGLRSCGHWNPGWSEPSPVLGAGQGHMDTDLQHRLG